MATRRNKAPNGNEDYLPASRRQPLPRVLTHNSPASLNGQRVNVVDVATFNDTTTNYIVYPYGGTSASTGEWLNVNWGNATTISNLGYAFQGVSSALTGMGETLREVTREWNNVRIQWEHDGVWGQIIPDYHPIIDPQKLEVINRKAKELLLSHLTDQQRNMWLAEKRFQLQAPSGRRYEIISGYYRNVFLLDQFGKRVREYCAYAKDKGGTLPVEDNVFAQMITLRYNEREFLAKANTWALPGKLFVGQGVDADIPVEQLAAA